MKSKEELIETMAQAIMEEDAMDYSMPYSSLAEAALKALCGALPDMPKGKTPWGSIEPDLVATKELYSQLKQWGLGR